ncbi:MAG: type II toxin-antitoxin system VapC family toxin [Armatimonadota bacterium]
MPDEQRVAATVLRDHQDRRIALSAPTIWEYEVANSLRTAALRGRIPEGFGRESLARLLGIGIRIAGFPEYALRAWELAIGLRIAVYDASYVALAEARECDLYTCDAQLARAAEDLVTVHLLGGE